MLYPVTLSHPNKVFTDKAKSSFEMLRALIIVSPSKHQKGCIQDLPLLVT